MKSSLFSHPNPFSKFVIHCILLCLVVDTFTLSVSDTKISTTRNSNRANICSYYSTTFTAQERQISKASVQQYSYLEDAEIQRLLFKNSFDYSSPFTLLITLPHLFSLVALLFLTPFLCCCCTWPEKYPMCRTWRKPDNEMYTKIELKWPAYLSLLLFLIVCIGGLIALIEAPLIIKKLNDVGCKKAAIFDDMLYGRLSSTTDGRFFVGLEPLRNELNIFNASKIATFFSDSTNALSSATQVRTKQNLIEKTLETTYTSYINSVYSSAFIGPSGTAYYDVNSAFKTLYLGPTSDSTKITGIIKSKLSTIFNEVNLALDGMISAWQTLNFATQSRVKAQLDSFDTAAQDLKTKLQAYLNEVGTNFNVVFIQLKKNTFYDQIYGLLSAYYGLVFGFAMLGFVGSILIAFCTVIRARLIVYLTCGFLVFLGIAGFCFLVYLMFIYPQMNQICSYVDRRLPSGNATRALLQNMGYQHYADKIASCMDDGDGKMISTLNSSFSTNFDMINVLARGTLQFNSKIPSFSQSNIDAPFKDIAPILSQVKNAEVWDIDDTQAKKHVNRTFMKNYTLGVTCNSVAINGDAWMPSFSLFTCPAGKSKMAPCADLSVQTTCPLGCYEILNEFVSPSGDHSYITTLAQRYDLSGGTTCNYYQYIVNLHNNWNIVRQNKMDSVNGSISSLKVIVDDYGTKTNSVKAGLNSFKTTLESNLNSMTNLTSGSFNGMDCRAIGQSIWDLRDSFCIGLAQSVKYNIMCLGLICYGILLLACFATCTSVRHFKHLQKMQMHVGYKGTPITLSDTRILDK